MSIRVSAAGGGRLFRDLDRFPACIFSSSAYTAESYRKKCRTKFAYIIFLLPASTAELRF